MKQKLFMMFAIAAMITSCSKSADEVIITAQEVNLNKTELTLTEGDTEQLTAKVLPESTTDKTVTWYSSNESVALISSQGVVHALAVGNTKITASCGSIKATCEITVKAKKIEAEKITLNITNLTLIEGDSEQLTAVVLPENTTDKTIAWSSSNKKIAEVSDEGVVTAVAAGNTTISATCGNITASCSVIVEKKSIIPASIDLGLSVNWSAFNYGATAPWEYGELYGWGGPAGKVINDQNYPTIDDIANTKYDVIAATWGKGYRMPSVAELNELMDKCTWLYTSTNNVKGYKVTGPNGNSIFIPASGFLDSDGIKERTERAFLWSSERFNVGSRNGSSLHIHESYQFMSMTPCNEGLSLRGVTTQKVTGKEFNLSYK